MKTMLLVLVLFFSLLTSPTKAQTRNNRTIFFHPVFNHSVIYLNDTFYKLNSTDSIQFETLRFYISGIELLNDDKLVWKEENRFHLVDASDKKSLQISLQTPSNFIFNKLKFNLGIDSVTNVSGAMGGDLDPTKGMYWTWQNGYINMKLEGKSNLCKTRNNEFQFHLGGYQYPFNALQTILLTISSEKLTDIYLDLQKLANDISLSNVNHLMSPSAESVFFSKKAAAVFSTIER
jgi:hypothetical protein